MVDAVLPKHVQGLTPVQGISPRLVDVIHGGGVPPQEIPMKAEIIGGGPPVNVGLARKKHAKCFEKKM